MRIAITGVAGFIGSNLAERLISRGHSVIGLDNLAYGARSQVPDGADFRQIDIRSADLKQHFAGVDVLFHLAAKNCISDCQADPVETADVNVHGTANVLESAAAVGVTRVIYADSSAVYEGCDVVPCSEDHAAPRSFYAVSKSAAGLFADAFARFRSIQITGLRYFGVYGPRQDYRRSIPPVMSAFIINLLRGVRPTIYGSGEKQRDFIFVDDVNNFHILCLRDDRTIGQTYNIGFGKAYSINQVYGMIARLLQSNVQPLYAPDLPGEAEMTLADIGKARALGWSPSVSLEEGLRQSVDYIKTHVIDGLRDRVG